MTAGVTEKQESNHAGHSEAGGGIWQRSFQDVSLFDDGPIPFHCSARHASTQKQHGESTDDIHAELEADRHDGEVCVARSICVKSIHQLKMSAAGDLNLSRFSAEFRGICTTAAALIDVGRRWNVHWRDLHLGH